MLHTLRAVSITAAASAALALSVSFAAAQDLETFTFMFPVESVNQFHPFYIADELGFFAEEGLEVSFQDAGGSSAAIQQVIAGNADAACPHRAHSSTPLHRASI